MPRGNFTPDVNNASLSEQFTCACESARMSKESSPGFLIIHGSEITM